jgi:hypothetical protein
MDRVDRWPSGASVLGVRNIDAAAVFLRDRLGFTITDLHGEPAFFAIASRDDCRVMLRRCQFLETRIASDWSVYVGVSDVSGLRAEITARGGPATELVDKDYGIREFEVRGPERHVFVFGQPISAGE